MLAVGPLDETRAIKAVRRSAAPHVRSPERVERGLHDAGGVADDHERGLGGREGFSRGGGGSRGSWGGGGGGGGAVARYAAVLASGGPPPGQWSPINRSRRRFHRASSRSYSRSRAARRLGAGTRFPRRVPPSESGATRVHHPMSRAPPAPATMYP